MRKSLKKSTSRRKSPSPKKSPCKKGWVINPLTGRCMMKFKEGYERSVVTGRWIKKCVNGKNRNTSSNRCNLIKKSPKRSRKSPKSPKRSRKNPKKSSRRKNTDSPILLFTYGTLMKSFYNNELLDRSKYMGKSTTVKKYYMTTNDYPFVYENIASVNIIGELYQVSKAVLDIIDMLEGFISTNNVDNFYYRKKIKVINNTKVVEAYIYFNNKKGSDKIPSGDYRLYNERVYYFAYGSNMNRKRMEERVGSKNIFDEMSATLDGYKLVFNKKAEKNGYAYANVIKDSESQVEGVLYEISENAEEILDDYEGIPKHYVSKKIMVEYDGIKFPATVYIANNNMVKNGLKVENSYRNNLLAGSKHLTKKYYKYIQNLNII
jgi:gamma-glutamylcyclotransferase (GGCT)/AIG2-like uncharacterized protein YtfP